MRVLFVHRDPALASARVRVLALVPHLEALGVECRTVLHPRGAGALRRLLRSSDADAIVLQKKLPTPGEAWAWRGRRAPLLFDYDDAVMFRAIARDGSHESRTRRRRFARALRTADAFVCGNEYLASFARPTAKPVLVSPSAVPLDVPHACPRLAQGGLRAPGGPLRVGWLGTPGNLDSLALLAPVFRRLADGHDLVVVVISEAPLGIEGVRCEHVPWRLATQEDDLARLDVGVMPLADSPWSRGKCAYKLLQYMAAAVPVVASPVGMNETVIRDGENGLLADSADAWYEALARLLSDPALADRLGAAGLATVREGFGYPRVARAWNEFLARVVYSAARPS